VKHIYLQASLTIATYDRHNIFIIQATEMMSPYYPSLFTLFLSIPFETGSLMLYNSLSLRVPAFGHVSLRQLAWRRF